MAILAGCVPIQRDPARAEFGVSIVRPDVGAAAPSKTEIARLAAKADQICTQGYTMTRVEVERANPGLTLRLVHVHDGRDLDVPEAEAVLGDVQALWGAPVQLATVVGEVGEVVLPADA